MIDSFKKTGKEIKNTVNKTFEEAKESVNDPSKLLNNVNMNVPKLPGLDLNKKDSTKTKKPEEEKKEDKPPK